MGVAPLTIRSNSSSVKMRLAGNLDSRYNYAMRLATAEDFSAATDPFLRPYLEYQPCGVEYSASLLESFKFATGLIASRLNRREHLLIIIGNPPFEILINKNKIVFYPGEDTYATTLHGVILLRIDQLLRCNPNEQVVVILEELVHGLMGIADELLARKIVAHMIPALVVTEKGYDLRELDRVSLV